MERDFKGLENRFTGRYGDYVSLRREASENVLPYTFSGYVHDYDMLNVSLGSNHPDQRGTGIAYLELLPEFLLDKIGASDRGMLAVFPLSAFDKQEIEERNPKKAKKTTSKKVKKTTSKRQSSS